MKTAKDFKDEIIQLVNLGYKPNYIANKLNLNYSTTNSFIKRLFPDINFLPNPGNINYFENIDSYSKAYIAGFICADGAIVKNKKTNCKTLTITLKYEDKDVLEFIKSEIGNSHKLLEIKRKSSFDKSKEIHHIRYYISNKKLISDLEKLGITENKSLNIGNIIENIPTEFKGAFIIGYFDGDGSATQIYTKKKGKIYKKHSCNINIRGTKDFLSGICDFLQIPKNLIKSYDSIPRLAFSKKEYVFNFIKCYKGLKFYYNRKFEKLLDSVSHPSYDKYKQVQTISSPI